MRSLKQWIKDDWERNKREWNEIKQEFTDIKNDTKRDLAEIKANAPTIRETIDDIKKEWAEQPTFKEAMKGAKEEMKRTYHEEREKQRRKDAERNPGPITRIFHAAMSAMLVIGGLALIPTIVGIPISLLMFGLAVYLWQGWVSKRPEQYIPKEYNDK